MKPFLLLLILAGFFSTQPVIAQLCTSTRYIDDLYSVNVIIEPDIYSEDALAIQYPPYISEGVTQDQDLSFNIYEPSGDNLTKRPLIIFAFGGAYLGGTKYQPQIVDYANAMAAKGFVVATIDYRIGFSLTNQNSAIRAVYRGGQDFRSAVRYFRANAATYNIDPNFIIGGGNSAGSINAIHAAYVVEADRTATSLFAPTYFVNNTLAPDWPDLGCLDCSGSNPNENGSPDAVINMWGAIGILNWINLSSEAPIISFHGDADNIVDIDTGPPWGVGAIFPDLYGSNPITAQAQSIGIVAEKHIFPGEGHEVWNNNTHMDFIIEESADFIYDLLSPADPDFFAASTVCEGQTIQYAAMNANPDSEYCWNIVGGTLISDNNNVIQVQWPTTGTGMISLNERTCHDIVGNTVSSSITINGVPNSNFSFAPNGLATSFTDLSSGAISWNWNFGDGSSSNQQNPSHTYTGAGPFLVELTVTNSDGCTHSFTQLVSFTTLATSLSSFDALLGHEAVDLIWETASEINSSVFEIERSTDAINFEQIGTTNAAGFSQQSTQYGFIDQAPKIGLNYYRLKLVDGEGGHAYSLLKEVFISKPGVVLFPNPVKEKLNIRLNNTDGQAVDILMFNTMGQLVKSISVVENTALDVSAFTPGIYQIVIFEQGKKSVQKLVIGF